MDPPHLATEPGAGHDHPTARQRDLGAHAQTHYYDLGLRTSGWMEVQNDLKDAEKKKKKETKKNKIKYFLVSPTLYLQYILLH